METTSYSLYSSLCKNSAIACAVTGKLLGAFQLNKFETSALNLIAGNL